MVDSKSLSTLLLEVADGVATITLHRVEARNALSRAMAEDLIACLATIQSMPQVRAVVLTGAGGHFCAGGDMRAVGAADARTVEERLGGMDLYRRLATELMGFGIPVIAAVDGVAYGAGLSLALLCDLVLVSDRVRLCAVFHRMGRIPDMAALYTLPRLVGLQRAKELVLSAREFDAAEALRIGVASEVLPVDLLLPRAHEFAAAFAHGPAVAQRVSKQVLNQSLGVGFEVLMQIEAAGQAAASASAFGQEAARRFVEKQPPLFQWPKPLGSE